MLLTQTKTETFRLFAALTIIIIVAFFSALGATPLFDVDEGAFSEATREMIISKNYLTAYLNGAPRFDKPILMYWLQLVSVKLFGINEFAFRLPSALAGAAWAISIFHVVRKESDNHQAFLAASIMVLSLQVMVISKAAIADGLLNCLLAITMFALLRHYKTGSQHALHLAFAAAGFGMLAKGPIAIIIPVAVTFLYSLLEKSLNRWRKMIFSPSGILLFLLIALPWYLLEYQEQGMDFINGFFFKHNISRFSSAFEGHSGSPFYYLPVIILGMTPFSGLIFTVLFNLKTLIDNSTNSFLLIWFGFVFVFFSISGTKLPHYIIYGYTPLFILMARAFPLSNHPERFALWPAIFLAGLSCFPLLLHNPPILLAILSCFPPALHNALCAVDDSYIQALLAGATELTGQTYLFVVISAIAGVTAIQFLPRLSSAHKLIATGLLFSLFINFYFTPLAGRLMQEPVKEAALLAKKEGYKIVMWKIYNPSFLVYSRSFVQKRLPEPGEIVLTTVRQLDKLDHPTVLYSKYGVVMAKQK